MLQPCYERCFPPTNPPAPPHGGHTHNIMCTVRCQAVYPPAWGPYSCSDTSQGIWPRLSPRMGAIHLYFAQSFFAVPSIPPHGGHTCMRSAFPEEEPVYPPAWGPYPKSQATIWLFLRLSPRMGAILVTWDVSVAGNPSIPPHGGHTACCRPGALRTAVYPPAWGPYIFYSAY